MRLFFDIENFVSYISSLYSDNVSITEDLLKLDRIVRNQEIHINNFESPFEKKSSKELPNDDLNDLEKFESVSEDLHEECIKSNKYLEVPHQYSESINIFIEKLSDFLEWSKDDYKKKKFINNFLIWITLSKNVLKCNSKYINQKTDDIESKIECYKSICITSNKEISNDEIQNVPLGNEVKYLKEIFLIDNETFKMYYKPDLLDWTFVKDNMELREIIIEDPFIFNSIDNINNINRLATFVLDRKSEKINLIILTKYDEELEVSNYLNYTLLLNEIKRKHKEKEINITIIWVKEDKSKNIKLHDRYILTNHRLFVSGHSFSNYFEYDYKKRKIKPQDNGGIFLIKSTFGLKSVEDIVSDLIKKIEKRIVDHKENIFFCGDKKTCFLDLSNLNKMEIKLNEEIKIIIDNDFEAEVEKDAGVFHCGPFFLILNNDERVEKGTKVKLHSFNIKKNYNKKDENKKDVIENKYKYSARYYKI